MNNVLPGLSNSCGSNVLRDTAFATSSLSRKDK
jgi:hypothetical protein